MAKSIDARLTRLEAVSRTGEYTAAVLGAWEMEAASNESRPCASGVVDATISCCPRKDRIDEPSAQHRTRGAIKYGQQRQFYPRYGGNTTET
jgi:hypothetical protein